MKMGQGCTYSDLAQVEGAYIGLVLIKNSAELKFGPYTDRKLHIIVISGNANLKHETGNHSMSDGDRHELLPFSELLISNRAVFPLRVLVIQVIEPTPPSTH